MSTSLRWSLPSRAYEPKRYATTTSWRWAKYFATKGNLSLMLTPTFFDLYINSLPAPTLCSLATIAIVAQNPENLKLLCKAVVRYDDAVW